MRKASVERFTPWRFAAPRADHACLRLEQFDGGVEMRMADPNKGNAVRAVLTEMDVDDAPVTYLGNDESEEDAFGILQNLGLCVLVQPHWRETAANLWLRPQSNFLRFSGIGWMAACRPMPGGQSHRQ